jgi:hypothetical protein
MFDILDNLGRGGHRRLMRPSASFQPFTSLMTSDTAIYNPILPEFVYLQTDTICMVSPSNGLYTVCYRIRHVSFLKTLRSCIAGMICYCSISVTLSWSHVAQLSTGLGSMRTHYNYFILMIGFEPMKRIAFHLRWTPFDLLSQQIPVQWLILLGTTILMYHYNSGKNNNIWEFSAFRGCS